MSKTKFAPDTSGGTVDLIYNAGHLTSGDDRVTAPTTVTVPANSSTMLTLTVSGGLTPGSIVQGWISLDGEGDNDLHFAYAAQVGPDNRIAK